MFRFHGLDVTTCFESKYQCIGFLKTYGFSKKAMVEF